MNEQWTGEHQRPKSFKTNSDGDIILHAFDHLVFLFEYLQDSNQFHELHKFVKSANTCYSNDFVHVLPIHTIRILKKHVERNDSKDVNEEP